MTRQTKTGCAECSGGIEPPFAFTMAFQPIVDVAMETAFAYEALVRGPAGESAADILSRVTPLNRYAFDQSCRIRAIALAAELGLPATGARLAINCRAGAVYSAASCIRPTLAAANSAGLPLDRLMFELTETEQIRDFEHLGSIVTEYRRHGFKMAIDDFGAGYAGLSLLANFSADIIKIDMGLVRGIAERPVALAIVKSIVALAKTLGCDLIAEGVETVEEFSALRACGIELMQGYLLARPAFEALPAFAVPRVARHRRLASL
jgi:EAL domain-containing protein (putative c-di-GMP-specific phosphodiesterase class I)